jgi:hypothetical protein
MSVTLQSQPSGSRPLPRRMAFPHPARLSPAVVETIHAVKTSPIQASPVVTQVPTTPVKGPKFTITVEEAPDSALSLTEENPASVAVAIKRTGKKRVNQPRPYLGLRNKDGEPLPRKVDLCSIDRVCLPRISSTKPVTNSTVPPPRRLQLSTIRMVSLLCLCEYLFSFATQTLLMSVMSLPVLPSFCPIGADVSLAHLHCCTPHTFFLWLYMY